VHGIVLIAIFWSLTIVGFCVLATALTALISDLVPVRQRGFVSGWMTAPQAVGIILGVVLITEVFATITLGYLAMAIGLAILVLPVLFATKEIPITKEQRPEATFEALVRGMWISRSEEHTSELQSRENLVCRL